MEAKINNIVDIKDIKKILRIFTENWWIILISLILSVVAAYFYSYKLPKIFASKAQVLLKSPDTYSIDEGLFKGLGISNSYERIANEQSILKSNDLIIQTISRLQLDVSYFIVGRIQTKEVFTGNPFHVESQVYNGAFYEFPFTLKIKDVDLFELSYSENGKQVVLESKFGTPIINKNFYLLINETGAINKATIDTFREITYQFVIHNRDNLVSMFNSSINVQNLEYTAILEITMEDESPERAISFLDTLCKVYIGNSLKSRIKVNENTINYIDRQLGQISTIVDSIEGILENFKEDKEILDLTKEQATYYENLTNNEIAKRNLELQEKSMAYLKEYVTSNMNRELRPPSIYIEDNDAYLKKAVSELYNYQIQINNALFTSTENITSVKEVEYKIELLRTDILKYIVSTEQAIKEKKQSIDEEIAHYEELLRGVPRNQREILNINRKLGVNEKMYVYLLEKRAETVIAKAGIISDIIIVESAHPIGIVKPDMKKIYYSFLAAGILISLLIAFSRTILFGKIRSIDELRDLTKLPVVGEVFFTNDAKESYLVVDSHPRSFVTESFRAIRTNLEYLAPGVKSKIILVTSNRPSVGKTFCSINLGSILAKGGKRVLILEMDLHKPKIHSALKLISNTGVSSVLVGKANPTEVIIKSSVENMDVILSGPAPPNASELILSTYLPELLDFARKNYDYVIIDTPPMGLISDALVLMKYSDINLYIINTKHGSMDSLQFAHNSVANNKAGSFAFILNNVKQKKSKYYYKNYSYGYGDTGYLKES